MITDSDIAEFQKLYKKHFGKAIKTDEAQKKLILLVRQMEIIYQPVSVANINEYGDKYEEDQREFQRAD